MMNYIPVLLDRLAKMKGFPVLMGLVLVIISFLAHFLVDYMPILSYLIAGEWLLHVGMIIGLGGLLFSDTL
ncbi:hypothetical protein QUF64_15985 [Anaerolineales bacterium HSG6]|nr:hypothetical protein [Anaerolineales bacterium HSG6]MDM8532346.1 hypothetical protein [Anaerolineales bacterium HSG25]